MKQIYLFPGQWAATKEPTEITTILGSCVGVALFDYKLKIGALNHYLLADLPPGDAPTARYGEVAMREIIDEMLALGSSKKFLQAKVYGGANVLSGVSIGEGIGNRNIALALRILEENRIPVVEQNVGGTKGRRIVLNTSTFAVGHQIHGAEKEQVDVSGFGNLKSLKKVRVVIVDDSATIRSLFQKIFMKHGIEVVGTAANAYEAREIIVKTKPDAITLDLEMPQMSGVAFLEKLMKYMPLPVVIVSSLGSQGEAAMRTLELGAVEFVHKPSQFDPAILSQLGEVLVEKVKAAASMDVLKAQKSRLNNQSLSSVKEAVAQPHRKPQAELKAIVIGGNAGSTESLRKILEKLQADTPPVVVANGTITSFLESYLAQLKRRVPVELNIAKQGDIIKSGHVYFAPDGQQLRIVKTAAGLQLDLKTEPPYSGQIPSSSVLFESAAVALGAGVTAILLSGFGTDGVDGIQKIQARGGTSFAENPKDLAFPFGPQKAISLGVIDQILDADEIAPALIQQRNHRVAG